MPAQRLLLSLFRQVSTLVQQLASATSPSDLIAFELDPTAITGQMALEVALKVAPAPPQAVVRS